MPCLSSTKVSITIESQDEFKWYSHSNQIEIEPHLLQEIIKIPLVVGRNWNCMGNLVNNIQLLKRKGNTKFSQARKTEGVVQQVCKREFITSMEI